MVRTSECVPAIPQSRLRLTAPFTQGSLALRGTGGHTGPPLREVGRCSGTNGNLVQNESLVRRGRARPLRVHHRWYQRVGRQGHRPLRVQHK